MKKTTSLTLGIVLLTVSLCLFSTDNIIAAIAGTATLLASVLLIQWADSMHRTQDDRRHRSNHNKH